MRFQAVLGFVLVLFLCVQKARNHPIEGPTGHPPRLQCPPLRCPSPDDGCTRVVSPFFWHQQGAGDVVPCRACDQCVHDRPAATSASSGSPGVNQQQVPLSRSGSGCLPLPCPLPPPNCTHLVQTFYWDRRDAGNEVLCPGCDVCADPNVNGQQQHKVPSSISDGCLPVPCPPPPPNCTNLVQMYFWERQGSGDEVLCPGCELCTDPNVRDQQQTSANSNLPAVQQHQVPLSTSGCLPLPCPPPSPNCTLLVGTFFWDRQDSGNRVLCPGCDVCTDPNVNDQQQIEVPLSTSDGCLLLPCPPPPPNCTHLVQMFYWERQGSGDKVFCPSCVMCADPNVMDRQQTQVYSDDLPVVQQHQVPLSSSSGCSPLPCPGPPQSNCTHLVQTFYWERQGSGDEILCPGCDVCTDPSVNGRHATRASGSPAVKQNRQVPLVVQDSQGCPELRCPVPIANCTHFVPLHYWHKMANGNLILCQGCDTCYSDEQVASSVTLSSVSEPEATDSPVKQPKVSGSPEKQRDILVSPDKQAEVLNLQGKQPAQDSQGCPELRCPVPIANCTHFVPLHYWHRMANGNLVLCQGCDTCYSDEQVASSVTLSSVSEPEATDSPVKQQEVFDSPDKPRGVPDSPGKQLEFLNLQGKQPEIRDSPMKQPDVPDSPVKHLKVPDSPEKQPEGRDVPFSPWCPPPPCPPPPLNCTHFEQTFYWNRQDSGNEVLCPGCDMCVYPYQ